jgi:UDP-4-amino-4,6-dideoxy-N-acetyl-beta-L-altrosamine transaminase
MIPYGKQDITISDIKAVEKVLKSPMLTQGPLVPIFEDNLAQFCKSKYATAVNSATSGLHLACLALGIKKGDIVWTSPITFVASANCALYCGADIDFIDIDPHTYNISYEALLKRLQGIKNKKEIPKLLILVHLCGLPTQLKEINKLCKKYGIKIIEDASHALGSKYENYVTGSCSFSDLTVFSFHPVKMITTAEGGMITTNSKALDRKLKALRTHGIYRPTSEKNSMPWFYDQKDLGFNYRMTDISAALGISQLSRLSRFVKKRNKIAQIYKKELSNLPLKFQHIPQNTLSSYHLFVIQLDGKLEENKKKRLSLYKHLRKNGIFVNLHYMPVYKHTYYKNLKEFKFLKYAEDYYVRSISIPIFISLKKSEQEFVIHTIRNFFIEKSL